MVSLTDINCLLILSEFRIAASGMAWKADAEASKAVTAIHNENVKWAQWLRVARGFQLRIGLKDHKREKFDGFAREVRAAEIAGRDQC